MFQVINRKSARSARLLHISLRSFLLGLASRWEEVLRGLFTPGSVCVLLQNSQEHLELWCLNKQLLHAGILGNDSVQVPNMFKSQTENVKHSCTPLGPVHLSLKGSRFPPKIFK